ncbi:hypothetical protein [Spiroplasma sp. DGKH1]|uniref:hypothetical protein n=1 Tax=Spiroplasma sp. DGKH1 TaxID=3050074 RepID=UPI0034C69435
MWKNKKFITSFIFLQLALLIVLFFVVFASINTVIMQNKTTTITGFQIFKIINNNFHSGYIPIPGFVYVIIYGSSNSLANFNFDYWWTLKLSLLLALVVAPILLIIGTVMMTKYFTKTSPQVYQFLIKCRNFFNYKHVFILLLIISLIPNLIAPFYYKQNSRQNDKAFIPFDLAQIRKPTSSAVYLGANQERWTTIFNAAVVQYLSQFDQTGTFNSSELVFQYYQQDKEINLAAIKDGDFITVIVSGQNDAKTVVNKTQPLHYQVFNTTVDLTSITALPPIPKPVGALDATKVTQEEIKNVLVEPVLGLLQQKNSGISANDFDITVYQKKDANTEIETINMSDKVTTLYVIITADSHSLILNGKTGYLTVSFPAIGSAQIDLSIIKFLPDQELPIITNNPHQVCHAEIINNLQHLINPIVLQLYHQITINDYTFEIYDSLSTTVPISTIDLSQEVMIYVQIKSKNDSLIVSGETNYIAVNLLHATSERTELSKLVMLTPLTTGIKANDVQQVTHNEIITGLKDHLLNDIQKIDYDVISNDYTYEIYNSPNNTDIVTTVNMINRGVKLYLKVFAQATSKQLTGESNFLEVYFPAAIGVKTNLTNIPSLEQPLKGISASDPTAVTYQEIFQAIGPLILTTLTQVNPQTIASDYTYQIYNSRNASDVVTTVDMSKSYITIFVKISAVSSSQHWTGISNYLSVKFPLATQGKKTISTITTIQAPREGITTTVPNGVKHDEITRALDSNVLAAVQIINPAVTTKDFTYEIYRDQNAKEPITLIDMTAETTIFLVIKATSESALIKDHSQIIAVKFPPAIKEQTDLINLTAIEELSKGIIAANPRAVTHQEIYDAIKANVFAAVKFLDPAATEQDYTFEMYNSRNASDVVTTVDMSTYWITLYFKVSAVKNSSILKGVTNYLPVKFPLART